MNSQRKCGTVEEPRQRDRPSAEPPRDLLGLRVFVAEDEPMILWALEDYLAELGCKVVGTASRVDEGLAFVANQPFDIAVLDGTLTDESVAPVVELLIARGTPFILASGRASPDFAEAFSNVVALQKPYTIADLRQALLVALAQAPAQQRRL
jgi:CheY-like chemotaxis protein